MESPGIVRFGGPQSISENMIGCLRILLKQPFVVVFPFSTLISQNQQNKSQCLLVGGFNPFEKNISQIGSFPQVGMNCDAKSFFSDTNTELLRNNSKLSPSFGGPDFFSIKTIYILRGSNAPW